MPSSNKSTGSSDKDTQKLASIPENQEETSGLLHPDARSSHDAGGSYQATSQSAASGTGLESDNLEIYKDVSLRSKASENEDTMGERKRQVSEATSKQSVKDREVQPANEDLDHPRESMKTDLDNSPKESLAGNNNKQTPNKDTGVANRKESEDKDDNDFYYSTFSCTQDTALCCFGIGCPMLIFANVVKKVFEEWAESSNTHFNTSIWACAYSPCSVFWLRRRMRQLLGLGSGHNGCKDCVVSFFCTNCVMCALAREINLDMFVEKIQKE